MCTVMDYIAAPEGWIWVSIITVTVLFSSQGLYQGGFSYHLAISGKSFAALCEDFPEYLPKVG